MMMKQQFDSLSDYSIRVLLYFLIINLGVFIAFSNCSADASEITVLDREQSTATLTEMTPQLAQQRVIFIGERHDRYDHHLNQLAVIRQLYEQHTNWVIGLEFLQQPFQQALDDYINGVIEEREFLVKTEYFQRWGYDYRLYRDIFRYAREHKIPMLALNISQEITARVAEVGIAGLESDERSQLPASIDKSDDDYRQHLQQIFQHHPNADSKNFDNFWETQLAWDESMAERAADYLNNHPQQSMIILAGAGHIARGAGIPNRLKRRLPVSMSLLLPASDKAEIAEDPQAADYYLLSEPVELPGSGKMGVMLDLQDGITAKKVLEDSAAENAGLQDGDKILAINGQPVESLTDIRWTLMDKHPGDAISVKIQRGSDDQLQQLSMEITLQE